MNTFVLETIGGLDILWTIFNAIAALLNPSGPNGILKLFVAMGTYIGATIAVWMLVFKGQIQQFAKWFIGYCILSLALVGTPSTLIIKDSMTNQTRHIDHVPFILAFGSSTISGFGTGLTKIIEHVFQSSPSESIGGSGITGNPPSTYSQTGFMFGAEMMKNMKRVEFTNVNLEQNMFSFVNQCVTYDALIGRKYTLNDLKHSSDLWGLVSKNASKLRGFPWRRLLDPKGIEILTCAEGVQRLNHFWGEMNTSSLHNFTMKMTGNQSWSASNNKDISNRVLAYLPGAFEKLTKNGRQAADHIKQQLMISSIMKGTEQKTVELGGSPDFEVRRAYFQQHESNKTIGHLIAQMLPSIKNVLEALLYCLFIIMVPMLLLPGGGGLLVFYFKILLWLQLWSPLFSFLNFIMTEAMSWQAISALKGDDGITIGNFVGLTNMTNDMASIAGYLCTMIPVLSWAIMDRGGYAIVNMASGLLGVAQGAGTQAAIEKVTGNYSYGNTSFGNQQLLTASHLRQDHTPSYSGHGHMMMHDGPTSMLTSSSGEKVLTMQESHIPVSLNVAQTQEHALRESQRDLYNFSESEQKSSQRSTQQAQNHYLEIGKQAQHMFSSGVQISDQQQAQSLREAANHYSKVEDISNRTGLSKDYVNQKSIEVSGGLGLSAVVADVSSKINKVETSNMSANQAAEEIFTLGKSTNFNQSHQRMDSAFKSKSLDVNDQNLKQSINNFSSSHETAKRYEESANKSFEKARALDHEIAFTQSNASTINASHNQAFVDHVGADELKQMSVQEQQRKAYNYMQNQMNLEAYIPKRSYSQDDIKSDYQLSKHDQLLTTPESIQKSHKDFEKGDYKKQSVEGANQREAYFVEKKVNQMLDDESERIKEAETLAKRQKFQAQQSFQRDHHKHAEENMGFTQEGVTKEQLKKHKDKKNG